MEPSTTKHTGRRLVLSILCLFVAIPTLTSVHLHCLPATAPTGFEFEPETSLDYLPDVEWLFPLPYEQDAYLGTIISIGLDSFAASFEQQGEAILIDETAGQDAAPVPLIPVDDWPQHSGEPLDFRPPQPLSPWNEYRVEAMVCTADSEDEPVFDCSAIAWSFATRDLGLALEPDVDLSQVGFYIDMQDIETRHFDSDLRYVLEGAAHDLDDVVFSISAEIGASTTVISQDDPDTSGIRADPCLVTVDLDGVWDDEPPEAAIGPMDVNIAAGPFEGSVWQLEANIVLGPDLSRAYVERISATVDTRLYDQFMMEDGAVTCDFSCEDEDERTKGKAELRAALRELAPEKSRQRDDWYLGYSCEALAYVGTCEECPDGTGPYCLTVESNPVYAYPADDVVQPRTPESIAADPEC